MRRDELPLATLDGRQAAMRLAQPCDCGRLRCTLGDHLWDSTRNMAPGPKAANTDPRGRTWPTDTDAPEPVDPTASIHPQYLALLDMFQKSARNLTRFIDDNRPDRRIPLPDPGTDDDWCRNHLEFGHCIRPYRAHLCRFCYDIGQEFGTEPDSILIRAEHESRRITSTLIGDFQARIKIAKRIRRKVAS